MCTTQKYNEGGNYAQNPSPAVENQPLTPPNYVERLNDLQTDLLDLVDTFASMGSEADPVQFITDMLQGLLTQPAETFASHLTRGQLKQGLLMIAFFDELRRQLYQHEAVRRMLEGGKEVSHD